LLAWLLLAKGRKTNGGVRPLDIIAAAKIPRLNMLNAAQTAMIRLEENLL
jgi:hypothetical protein